MTAALNVVALLGGTLGMLPLLSSLFAPPADQVTTVRIAVGASADLSSSLSGNTPGVALWDFNGRAIGATPGSSNVILQGNTVTVTIEPNVTIGNIQPEYMSITNGGDDALCIALLTVTFPNGLGQSSFSGDVGKICGAPWYPSSELFGPQSNSPACVWIDRNDSNGLKYQGFGVHLSDFFNVPAKANEYNQNHDTMCLSGPRFRMYEKITTKDPILFFDPPIDMNPDSSDANLADVINNPGKLTEPQWSLLPLECEPGVTSNPQCTPIIQDRAINKRIPTPTSNRTSIFMEGHLVVSSFQGHSAQEVCESTTSRGPDFVSLQEGFHCDMTTRLITPVCSGNTTTCCFDLTAHMMRPCGVIRGSTAAISGSAKKYDHVHQWTPPNNGTSSKT